MDTRLGNWAGDNAGHPEGTHRTMSSAGGVTGHLLALTSLPGIPGCFCLCVAHVHSPAGQASGRGGAGRSSQRGEWAVVGTAVTGPAGGWSGCWANRLRGGCVSLHAQWPECHTIDRRACAPRGWKGPQCCGPDKAPLRSLWAKDCLWLQTVGGPVILETFSCPSGMGRTIGNLFRFRADSAES